MSLTAGRRPGRLKQALMVGGHRVKHGAEVRGSWADRGSFSYVVEDPVCLAEQWNWTWNVPSVLREDRYDQFG